MHYSYFLIFIFIVKNWREETEKKKKKKKNYIKKNENLLALSLIEQ